jgi:dolichol-phosphate mannosyltransferase
MNRVVKGLLDPLTIWFLTKYGQRPMHLLGGIGLIVIALGVVGWCFNVAKAFYWYISMSATPAMEMGAGAAALTYTATVVVLFPLAPVLIGMFFIALGFFAELFVSRTIQPERCYSVRRSLGKGELGTKTASGRVEPD